MEGFVDAVMLQIHSPYRGQRMNHLVCSETDKFGGNCVCKKSDFFFFFFFFVSCQICQFHCNTIPKSESKVLNVKLNVSRRKFYNVCVV